MRNAMTLPSPVTTVENAAAVLETMSAGISENTKRVYGNSLRTLERFYGERGWVLYPLGDNDELDELRFIEQALSYLQSLSDAGRKHSTLNLHLSALKYRCGFENQRALGALATKPVSTFMEGVARQGARNHSPRQAAALSVEQLRAVYKTFDTSTPRGRRDMALVSLGLATALRSQSLADLTLADVAPAVTIDGLTVRVRYSKTDQKGKGALIPVGRASKKRLDPVNALTSWLEVLAAYGFTKESQPDFPLFPVIRGSRGIQHSPIQYPNLLITDLLRKALVRAEVCSESEARAFSSHSLRASFITLSNLAGVAERDIAAITGHKSMAILRGYDRTSVERSAQTAYLG